MSELNGELKKLQIAALKDKEMENKRVVTTLITHRMGDRMRWYNIHLIGIPEDRLDRWERNNTQRYNGQEFSKLQKKHESLALGTIVYSKED